ncbi:MAG TPA: glycosyltransferase family 2 protein [Candidatus Angelobacter sp.]
MRFTVLTPTYNRAHTLSRVYESLCAQTFRDFEWVIVDDGSTDSTRELVEGWKAFFPIRYSWKPNAGKHTAMNAGVAAAHGEFVLFLDSDDRCTANALERFDYHWRKIPDPTRFANLSCLCSRPDGSIVGEPYPMQYVDAFTLADQLRYRVGERWGINRTDVLRQFPFPEGERFVPEALVWNRISRRYAARFFNEALRTYEPGADSLSVKMFEIRANSPRATLAYYRELALSSVPMSLRLRASLNFLRFAGVAAMRKLGR